VEVPFDHDYVIYVWFDALLNYLTGIGYDTDSRWAERWSSCEHLIGKDILKPHAIYWPIMLHAAGLEPCRHLTVHGYWNFRDLKISKSSGRPVDVVPLVRAFGADAIRYFLARDMVIGLDAKFTPELLVQRINSDLANDLGNLLSRISKLVGDHFDGRMPAPANEGSELRPLAAALVESLSAWIAEFRLHTLIEETLQLVRATNRYFESSAPWALAKTDKPRCGEVLYECAEALRIAAVVLHPVMPRKTAELFARMGEPVENLRLEATAWGRLRQGAKLEPGEPLFPRIEERNLPTMLPELFESSSGAEPAPLPETNLIDIAAFAKVQMRVARVVSAARLPNTDKLMKLSVELGGEQRQIVAGIAHRYAPETLVGRLIVVVVNLKPATLRGETSHGMLLAAKSDGNLVLLTVDQDIEPGAQVS